MTGGLANASVARLLNVTVDVDAGTFTENQEFAIHAAVLVSAIVSLMGTSCILGVSTYMKFYADAGARLVINLSLADWLVSVGYIIGIATVDGTSRGIIGYR
jgi:hypothetical protein